MNDYVVNAPRKSILIKIAIFSLLCILSITISALFFNGTDFSNQLTLSNMAFILPLFAIFPFPLSLFTEQTLIFSKDTIKVQSWINQLLKRNHFSSFPLQDVSVVDGGYMLLDTFFRCYILLENFDKTKKEGIFFTFLSKEKLISQLNNGKLKIKIQTPIGHSE